jgi:hypothetical protein
MKSLKLLGTIALGLTLSLQTASPLLAASRSHSVDVSCVVKPVFQISSPAIGPAQSSTASDPLGGFQPIKRSELGVSGKDSGIAVQSNLANTRVRVETRRLGGVNVRVYSVTVI